MNNQTNFYQFLEPISKELALVARELEASIFTSPRTMLTHARVFVENVLQKVIQFENVTEDTRTSLKERIDLLNENGLLSTEIRDALHHVRQIGNQAAHDSRPFRFSEALLSWESVYRIVKWYVECYGPVDLKVPDYQDPIPPKEIKYDISELEIRLKAMEELLTSSMQRISGEAAQKEVAVTTTTTPSTVENEIPGFTAIRALSFKGEHIEIPSFLRDAFLLPQRFEKSETFLIRLGAEQQARIMSELPNNLEGLHKHVKRYSEKNEEILFEELKTYIQEEKKRRQISLERQGELFLFFKEDYIIVTEELKKIPLTVNEFSGIPSLLKQLNDDQIESVGQLPMELVILAKYKSVGVSVVAKLFEQLKEKQALNNQSLENSVLIKNKKGVQISIYKNGNLIAECSSIQEAARFLKEDSKDTHLRFAKIERGYVYGEPWSINGATYIFKADESIISKRKTELERSLK